MLNNARHLLATASLFGGSASNKSSATKNKSTQPKCDTSAQNGLQKFGENKEKGAEEEDEEVGVKVNEKKKKKKKQKKTRRRDETTLESKKSEKRVESGTIKLETSNNQTGARKHPPTSANSNGDLSSKSYKLSQQTASGGVIDACALSDLLPRRRQQIMRLPVANPSSLMVPVMIDDSDVCGAYKYNDNDNDDDDEHLARNDLDDEFLLGENMNQITHINADNTINSLTTKQRLQQQQRRRLIDEPPPPIASHLQARDDQNVADKLSLMYRQHYLSSLQSIGGEPLQCADSDADEPQAADVARQHLFGDKHSSLQVVDANHHHHHRTTCNTHWRQQTLESAAQHNRCGVTSVQAPVQQSHLAHGVRCCTNHHHRHLTCRKNTSSSSSCVEQHTILNQPLAATNLRPSTPSTAATFYYEEPQHIQQAYVESVGHNNNNNNNTHSHQPRTFNKDQFVANLEHQIRQQQQAIYQHRNLISEQYNNNNNNYNQQQQHQTNLIQGHVLYSHQFNPLLASNRQKHHITTTSTSSSSSTLNGGGGDINNNYQIKTISKPRIMQTSGSRQFLTSSPDTHATHNHSQKQQRRHQHHQQQRQVSPSIRRTTNNYNNNSNSNHNNSKSQQQIKNEISSQMAKQINHQQHQRSMPKKLALDQRQQQQQQQASALSCCGRMAKFFLFIANALFWGAGIALGAWGILALVDDHKYNLSQLLVFEPSSRMSLFQLLSWSFITLGCATILVGFCGCSAMVKNSRWILGLYIFLILAIFALDLATGLLAIIFQERLVANVRLRLVNKLRTEYGIQASFTAAIDYIQTRYECCGMDGHFDYDQSLWRLQRLGGFEATVARTCCHLRNTFDDQAHVNPRPVNESMCQSVDVRFHQSYRYRRGCLDDLERLIRHKIWTFTIGCGIVGAIILLSLLFATCFCRSIPHSSSRKSSSSSSAMAPVSSSFEKSGAKHRVQQQALAYAENVSNKQHQHMTSYR